MIKEKLEKFIKAQVEKEIETHYLSVESRKRLEEAEKEIGDLKKKMINLKKPKEKKPNHWWPSKKGIC